MNKNICRTEKIIIEEGTSRSCILEYYLTQEQHPFKTGNINYMCYGVEICMRNENSDEYDEIESVSDIFSSKEIAVNFINMLADEQVTPCTLKDVVSDVLIQALSR